MPISESKLIAWTTPGALTGSAAAHTSIKAALDAHSWPDGMSFETFKSSKKLAHGLTPTFKDGFGCTIADAVVASCAAVPYFSKVQLTTENQQAPVLIDGGFVANNPTLFALADALGPLGIDKIDVRVISIGVGSYRERPGWTVVP